MNHLIFIAVIIGAWIITILIAFLFANYIKNANGVYNKSIVEKGNNIFSYGLFGFIAVSGRYSIQNITTYYIMIAIFIVFGILLLIDLLKTIFTIVTTLILMFDKNYYGLENAGKLGDWIFISSMIVESALMGFITLNMFNSIF